MSIFSKSVLKAQDYKETQIIIRETCNEGIWLQIDSPYMSNLTNSIPGRYLFKVDQAELKQFLSNLSKLTNKGKNLIKSFDTHNPEY